ncbi:hypothetical protein B0H21DRAFT_809843 [Amylocystis lapponica]|nr:hypothetical protein B0H21DRAFT_809843 [Amylocystis lapponica]
MRDANVYSFRRAMPRMSWHPRNLYNLWRRSLGAKVQDTVFTVTTKSLYQQRWAAKALLRAYHGDYINEKTFKRWYLPSTLPDVRSQVDKGKDLAALNKWALRVQTADKEKKRIEEEQRKGLAPVGSLMFREVERRIDVIIFRACLAHSVYEARRLVIHGDVLLNGKKHQDPNTRLAPGDMVSVDPEAIRFLQASAAPQETKPSTQATTQDDSSADAAEATAEEVSSEEQSASADSLDSDTSPDAETSSKKVSSAAPPPKPTKKSQLTPFHLPPYASPFIFVPAYIEASFATCSAIYVRHPTARPGYSEIPTPWDADGEVVRAAWEWYSRVRPRMRSKSQRARTPENRQ